MEWLLGKNGETTVYASVGSEGLEDVEGVDGVKSREIESYPPDKHGEAREVGGKIGVFGSIALVVNNISGPGMLSFPSAYARTNGWYVTFSILVAACCSAFAATCVIDAAARVESAHERLEFSAIFGRIFGQRTFVVTQWLYFFNLFSQNVAAIITTAQATDGLIASVFGSSWGLALFSNTSYLKIQAWPACLGEMCTPFNETKYIMSAGYLVCLITLLPLGLLSLEENMLAQKISFILLIVLCLEFTLVEFVPRLDSFESHTSHIYKSNNLRDLAGVVLFNFAFCVTVPSWRNDKDPKVDARRVVWTSCLSSGLGYAVFGYLGALAFPKASDNILDELTSKHTHYITRVAGGIFAWAIIGLGIPVFAVLMRYNLAHGGVMNPRPAAFISAIFPWIISWTFYHGHAILGILSWSGLLFDSMIDFLLPAAAALAVGWLASHKALQKKPHAAAENTDPLPAALMSTMYFPIAATVFFIIALSVLLSIYLQLRYSIVSSPQ